MSYNPKTDISPKFIFWFWFIPAFILWIIINIMVFKPQNNVVPTFDDQGNMQCSQEEFERYILFGEEKDTTPLIKIVISLSTLSWLIWWGARLQVEMWALRKLGRVTRRFINKE